MGRTGPKGSRHANWQAGSATRSSKSLYLDVFTFEWAGIQRILQEQWRIRGNKNETQNGKWVHGGFCRIEGILRLEVGAQGTGFEVQG